MPELPDTYREVRKSIVAFVHRFGQSPTPPPFPHIIGTGFVIDSDGIVATNDHVIDEIGRAPRPPGFQEWPVAGMLLHMTEHGMVGVPLPIVGVFKPQDMPVTGVYYGEKPDVGAVMVRMRGLPTLTADPKPALHEGALVATAGYPMGTPALVAPGYLNQLGPTLQAGIISAVHPFPCDLPHGFTVNVMTQGGASGSPVFRPEDGSVIGIVYAGLHENEQTPTNYTFAVPSLYLAKLVEQVRAVPEFAEHSQYPTLSEALGTMRYINALTGQPFEKS